MSSHRQGETRDFALENAIASNEIEGVEFTPAMRALLERAIRENMSDEAFTQAAIEVTRTAPGGSSSAETSLSTTFTQSRD